MRSFFKKIARKITTHSKLPLFLALPIELISAIQIIHITLASAFDSNLSNYFFFSAYAREITQYLGAVNLFDPLASESTIQGVFYALLGYFGVHILLLAGLVFLQARFSNYNLSWRMWEFISKLYLLHSRLFFFPILYFFVGVIKVKIQCDDKGYEGFYCETAWEGLAILACIFNLMLALLQESMFYDMSKTKNAYAVKSNSFQLIVLLHKTVGVILFFLIKELDYNDVVAGVLDTCLALLAFYMFYRSLPFYKSIMIKTRVLLNGITLGCSISLLLATFGVDLEVMEIIFMVLVMLTAKISLVILNMLNKSILQGRFQTPERALYFVTLLKANNFGHFLGVDRVKYPLGSILINGALINQNIETSAIKLGKNVKDYEDEVYSLLLEKFNAILYRNQKSVPLALYITHLYMKRQGNIIQSITLMKKMSNLSLSIAKENAIEEFFLNLKKIYMDKYRDKENNLNMLEYFTYRDIANQMKEEIKAETQMHLDFWMELRKEKDISCKRAFDLAYGVEALSSNLEMKFQQYIFAFSRTLANSLLLSKMYLERLREMPNEARKNMKKFIAIVHNPMARHPLDVYSNEKAILILSLKKDHIGEIIDASGSTQTLFQIDKSKFMRLGLSTLFPEVFAREHTGFLSSFLKNSSTHKSRYKMKTYGKNKDGNFFELLAKFQLYPEIDQEVKVMVQLQRVTSPIPVLLVGLDGTIIDCSENVKQNLNGTNIVVGATKLQNLSLDYDLINSAFNMVYAPKGETRGSVKSGTTGSAGMRMHKFSQKVMNHMSYAKTAYDDRYTTFTTESEKLDSDKAQKICENYMEGAKLVFSEFSHNTEIEYDVQINPFVLEGGFYKVVTIKNQEYFITKQQSKMVSIDFEKKMTQLTSNVTQDQSLFAEDFPIADEREGLGPFVRQQQRGISMKSEVPSEIPMNRTLINLLSTNYAKQNMNDLASTSKILSVPGDDRSVMKSLELFVKPDRVADSRTTEEVEQAKAKLSSSINPGKTQEIQREMSVASYATSGVYTIKTMKRVFTDASTFPLPRNTFLITTFLTLIMFVIAIVFFSYSRKTIDEHTDNTNIIDGVGQRLSYAVSSWQLITRLYLSRVGLGNDDVDYVRENISTESLMLLKTNNEVNEELALILSEERLRDVFEADILFWEPYQNTTTTQNPINTFHATHILYDNLNEIVSQGANSLEDISVDDLIYAMNNTANDYFMSSEKLYSKTHDLLEELLDKNLFNLQLILVAISLVITTLGVVLLVVSYLIVQSYRRLFRALMKIEDYQVSFVIAQLKKFQIYLEVDIENNKFAVEDSGTFAETRIALKEHKKTNTKKRGGFSNREDRFTVRVLSLFLLKSIAFSIIFIVIPAALFYIALYDAIDDFDELDILDDQLSIAAKAQYQANLIMTVFYMEMMFRNDTTILIRDDLPRNLLDDVVNDMTALHEELSQSFFSQLDIIDDPMISQLLQENVCPLLVNPTETLMNSCLIATNGGELGLFSLNVGYTTLSNTYIYAYLQEPTEANADALVEPYSDAVREIMETMEAAYDFLNDHLISIMDDKVEKFKVKQDVFFGSMIGSIALAFIMVYFFSIKKYRYVDMGRGKILKMIPYSIIQDNRAIEFYLNKDFEAKKYNFGRKN